MKHSKRDLDAIIENATLGIRDEQIDPSMINESATRVWARVSRQASENSSERISHLEGLNTMTSSNNTEQIRGCDDFRSLIPAYLGGKLSAARTLLLEDHSGECIPCRRELNAQRSGSTAKPAAVQTARTRTGIFANFNALRWGFAAVLVVCLGLAGMFAYERIDPSGSTLAATVENSNGAVYLVSDVQFRQLAAGELLNKGDKIRTAKGSNAVLRLADGSTIEMRERSEFSVTENMRGVTVKLERGDVIVEAAKQHNGRLYRPIQ